MMSQHVSAPTKSADVAAAMTPAQRPRLPAGLTSDQYERALVDGETDACDCGAHGGPLFDFAHIPVSAVQAAVPSAQLAVSQPGDRDEVEADRVADAVLAQAPSTAGRSAAAGAACQTCAGMVHRKCTKCSEEDEQARTQRKPNGHAPAAVSRASLEMHGGAPLPAGVRGDFEARFGHDFSRVRVHTDAQAATAAHELSARAFTIGTDMAFAPGEFQPATSEGRRLIAHELAHVVQQGGPTTTAALHRAAVGPADSTAEREADSAADAAVAGLQPRLRHHAPVGLVQRQPASTGTATPGTAPVEDISLQQEENDPLRQPVPEGLPSGVSIQRRQDVPCGKEFVDAELYQDGEGRATLTISVRTWFVFMPDGGKWTISEQQSWQDKFIKLVTEKWSLKHYLEPADELCPDLPVPRVAVNVRCVPVPAGAPRHLDVMVYRDEEAWDRSHVERAKWISDTAVDQGRPKPLSAANMRVRESEIEEGISGQVVVEHEFGHALGIDHVVCIGGEHECYGKGDEAADLMGRGPTVSARDYEPFVEVLRREFAPGCNWKVTPASAEPHNMAPIVLGVIGGILGAAPGAALGFLAGGPLGAFLGAALGGLALGGGLALAAHFTELQF